MEAAIQRALRAHLRAARSRARAPSTRAVPDHAETLVSIETDKEYAARDGRSSTMARRHRARRTSATTAAAIVEWILRSHGERAPRRDRAASRRAVRLRRLEPRRVHAHQGRVHLLRRDQGGRVRARCVRAPRRGGARRTLRLHGDASSSARARAYLRSLEQRYTERDKTNSTSFARRVARASSRTSPYSASPTSRRSRCEFAARPMTLEEINTARAHVVRDRRIASSSSRRRIGLNSSFPRSRRCSPSFDRAAGDSTLKAYVDSTSDAPLVATLPTPGKIVSERTLPETGILEWKLSNGARVAPQADRLQAR